MEASSHTCAQVLWGRCSYKLQSSPKGKFSVDNSIAHEPIGISRALSEDFKVKAIRFANVYRT